MIGPLPATSTSSGFTRSNWGVAVRTVGRRRANQHYITGYGWSFYTPQVVLVPLEDVEPVWIGRAMMRRRILTA